MFALSVLVVYLLALGQFCDALPSDTQSTLVRKEWYVEQLPSQLAMLLIPRSL
jgi:hypothetical protein